MRWVLAQCHNKFRWKFLPSQKVCFLKKFIGKILCSFENNAGFFSCKSIFCLQEAKIGLLRAQNRTKNVFSLVRKMSIRFRCSSWPHDLRLPQSRINWLPSQSQNIFTENFFVSTTSIYPQKVSRTKEWSFVKRDDFIFQRTTKVYKICFSSKKSFSSKIARD